MPYRLRLLDEAEHEAFLAAAPAASFLQTPGWAAVKSDWRAERLGWVDGEHGSGEILGAVLVLYRPIPRVPRSLAYVPEGPVLDWARVADDVEGWLGPLRDHVRSRGAFTLKIGPPVITRRWPAATVKQAIADGSATRLQSVPPGTTEPAGEHLVAALRAAGWQREDGAGAGFGDVQPRYVFQVPLSGRSLDDVFAGFNQEWRRNIRKAEKAGVEVERGTLADLADFHRLYLVTAERDRFTGRPLAYFQRMLRALNGADPDRARLYLARHDGRLLAATLWVQVGDHVWYAYGASANEGRELRPSNAIQWRMITDAHAAGAATYDLRGISDTLDPADPLFGLIRFKLGTGGEVVELAGEWDLVLRPLWARAVNAYLRRRAVAR